MELIVVLLSSMVAASNTPIVMSLWLLLTSLGTSVLISIMLGSALLPSILVLTYSSGMITIIIYTSASTPNEIKKNFGWKWLAIPISVTLLVSENSPQWENTLTNWFSPTPYIVIITLILIISIAALADNSSNPTESIQSPF